MPAIIHPPCDNTGNFCQAMSFATETDRLVLEGLNNPTEMAMNATAAQCRERLIQRLGSDAAMAGAECPIYASGGNR
jgi:hypothetical protein